MTNEELMTPPTNEQIKFVMDTLVVRRLSASMDIVRRMALQLDRLQGEVTGLRKQAEEIAVLTNRLRSDVSEQNRCPNMLPNNYGQERCGRERGHEGKCCYARMD